MVRNAVWFATVNVNDQNSEGKIKTVIAKGVTRV